MRRERKSANELTQRLALPCVFPDTFAYVPIIFAADDAILGPDLLAIGNATYYEFGILSSDVHMAWLRMVERPSAGLCDYEPNRVYNTFPWPDAAKLTAELRAGVENAARLIESARHAHADFEFGKDYPADDMPADIAEAHRINNRAVRAAYGLPEEAPMNDVLVFLMRRYIELVEAEKARPVHQHARSGDRRHR